MGRGGARSRSGPAPDTNALRRGRDGAEWTRLPAIGRTDDIPDWPLEVEEATVRELALWQRLWKMPQALIWDADRAHNTVALYVRVYIASMATGAPASMVTQAKTLSAELMLTPDSLARGRYVIIGSADDKAINEAMDRHPAGNQRGGAGQRGTASTRLVVVPPPDEEDEGEGFDDGEIEDDAEDGEAPSAVARRDPEDDPPPF